MKLACMRSGRSRCSVACANPPFPGNDWHCIEEARTQAGRRPESPTPGTVAIASPIGCHGGAVVVSLVEPFLSPSKFPNPVVNGISLRVLNGCARVSRNVRR